MPDSADWSGLEVTGGDNLVDGGWTSLKLTEQRTRCLEQRRRLLAAPISPPRTSIVVGLAWPARRKRGALPEPLFWEPRRPCTAGVAPPMHSPPAATGSHSAGASSISPTPTPRRGTAAALLATSFEAGRSFPQRARLREQLERFKERGRTAMSKAGPGSSALGA